MINGYMYLGKTKEVKNNFFEGFSFLFCI